MTTARDIMHTGASCIREHETLDAAAQHMRDLGVGALPICGDDDRLHGMLTDRDIVIHGLAAGLDPATTTAGQLAQGNIYHVDVDADIQEMLNVMEEHQVRRLPVLDNHAWSASSARPTSPGTSPSTPLCNSSRRSARLRPSQVTKSAPKAADHVHPRRVRHRSDLGVHERDRIWGRAPVQHSTRFRVRYARRRRAGRLCPLVRDSWRRPSGTQGGPAGELPGRRDAGPTTSSRRACAVSVNLVFRRELPE